MRKILIVDDEKIEREGVKRLIRRELADVVLIEAVNGQQGLELAKSEEPDLIFTDIKMPFLTGIELAEKIHEYSPETPIVIFTGYSDFEYARRAMKNGVLDYLLKPIDPKEFRETLKRIMELIEDRERQTAVFLREQELTEEYIRRYEEQLRVAAAGEQCGNAVFGGQQDIETTIRAQHGGETVPGGSRDGETTIRVQRGEETVAGGPRDEKTAAHPGAQSDVEKVKNYIYEHYAEELSVDILRQHVYLSAGYMSYIFKKETGVGLSQFIRAYRLEKAKQLLETTNKKIVQICTETGFTNASYFCKNFREYYGMSPEKFRKGDGSVGE